MIWSSESLETLVRIYCLILAGKKDWPRFMFCADVGSANEMRNRGERGEKAERWSGRAISEAAKSAAYQQKNR